MTYYDKNENTGLTIAKHHIEKWDGHRVEGTPPQTGFDAILYTENEGMFFLEFKMRDCSSTDFKPTEYFIKKSKVDFMYRLNKKRSFLIYMLTDCWFMFRIDNIVNRPYFIKEVKDPGESAKQGKTVMVKEENYFLNLEEGLQYDYDDPENVKKLIKESINRDL